MRVPRLRLPVSVFGGSNQCAVTTRTKLVAELRHSTDEASSEHPRSALSNVDVCGNVYASEAETCHKTTKDQYCVRIRDNLNNAV